MAFLFGKKKGTHHREGTPPSAGPNPALAAALATTPPASQNNSLNNVSTNGSVGSGDAGSSPKARPPVTGIVQHQQQMVAPRAHQAQNSDATTPSPSQGRALLQQSPPAHQQLLQQQQQQQLQQQNPQQQQQQQQQQQPSGNASLYPWSQRRLSLNKSHPSPFPRYGHAANSVASKDGDIYIMGGLIRSQTVRGDLWMIEGESERLESYPVLTTSEGPGPRVGHASLLVGNAFIVYGGDTKLDERDVLDETLYLLNTSTRQWSRANPHGHRPSGRYGHTLNILGSKLYIFGGQVDTVFFNDLVAFDLNTLQHPGSKWEILVPAAEGAPDVPASRTNHTIVTWNDRLYLFGGTNGLEWFNDVWSYDPRTNLWTQLDCIGFIPSSREGHAAALVNDVMYIFGGRSSEGTDLGDLAAFRISSRRWYTFQNMGPSPSPRSGHTMSTVGSKVVVLGGEPSVPARSQEELQMVYILDTSKIRYPSDNAQITSPTGNRPGGPQRPIQPGQGIRNVPGPQEFPVADPRGPPKRGRESAPTSGRNSPTGASTPPVVGGVPFGPGGPVPGGPGPGGSRLPRAALANQPGPPPTQQAPPPRTNGTSPPKDPRSQPPIGSAVIKGKENLSPIQDQFPQPSNGSRALGEQQKESTDSGVAMEHTRSQQQSLDGAISERPEPQLPQPPRQESERPSLELRAIGDQPSFDESTTSPVAVKPPPLAPPPDSAEVDKLRRLNDWYVSELALARRGGYTPQTNHSVLLEDRTRDHLGEDERPFVEAMLALKGELAKIQGEVETQSAQASKRMQDIERQRDVAIQEAVYAKAKLAALGGPATPVPGSGSDTASIDAEKMHDMGRKLAASLSAQADLSAKVQLLTQEISSEKKARYLADETAAAAQKRIVELDEYRNKTGSEMESLRAQLLETHKAYRDEAALGQEAASDVQMLRIDQSELMARLEDTIIENKTYQDSLERLNLALQATNNKSHTLERQLEEERVVKESLERRLAQLRSEYEEKTADLQSVNQRLKDAEELMETYSEEARAASAVLSAGLDRVATREPTGILLSGSDDRVRVLKEQVENTQILLAKSKGQADETGEKLAEAMQRVAGLEYQQGQASKDSIALRRRMADLGDEARRLKQENADLVDRLGKRQLEVDSVSAKHNALKEILHERSGQPGSFIPDKRSRNLQSSPESGTATPEQLSRLHQLEARLEDSLRAHRETKNSAEIQAQEVEKHFREKLEQLENDYQSAVHYVKGTEKMLKRMKEELTKYKSQNLQLQQQLDEALQRQQRSGRDDADSEADWDQERELLNKEIGDLRTQVRDSATALDKQIRDTKSQLEHLRAERDHFQTQHSQIHQQLSHLTDKHTAAKSHVEKLEAENAVLETRAQSAEQKVSMLLDQVENSVDAYRRSTRLETGNTGLNGDLASARSSYYSGPDNRTSVALDSLASELDALRNHWESTNKTYRLSNTFEFERTPTSPVAEPAFGAGVSQWRQKLAVEEEVARSASSSRQEKEDQRNGLFSPATVAAGGGVI